MKKKTLLLIDTVMETSIASAWMLSDEVKHDLYLVHHGQPFIIDETHPDLSKMNLNYEIATLFFSLTWTSGYYSDLCDWDEVALHLEKTWNIY